MLTDACFYYYLQRPSNMTDGQDMMKILNTPRERKTAPHREIWYWGILSHIPLRSTMLIDFLIAYRSFIILYFKRFFKIESSSLFLHQVIKMRIDIMIKKNHKIPCVSYVLLRNNNASKYRVIYVI